MIIGRLSVAYQGTTILVTGNLQRVQRPDRNLVDAVIFVPDDVQVPSAKVMMRAMGYMLRGAASNLRITAFGFDFSIFCQQATGTIPKEFFSNIALLAHAHALVPSVFLFEKTIEPKISHVINGEQNISVQSQVSLQTQFHFISKKRLKKAIPRISVF